jgi:hypothetical protein
MTNCALHRNVCQLLEIAAAADINARRHPPPAPTEGGASANGLGGCGFAWIECATPTKALALETRMRAEFKPPLNRV